MVSISKALKRDFKAIDEKLQEIKTDYLQTLCDKEYLSCRKSGLSPCVASDELNYLAIPYPHPETE